MSVQSDVREAISRADVLSRIAHEQHEDELAGVLDGLRSELDWIDEAIGGGRPAPLLLPDLEHTLAHVEALAHKLGEDLSEVLEDTVSWMRGLHADLQAALADRPARVRKLVRIAGVACIAAPFVFGYSRRAPKLAALQVVLGFGALVGSVFSQPR